jgi:hypothetical protein
MTHKNTWCSADAIVAYGKHIDIPFTEGDVEEMLAYAKEWEIVDTKTLVWEFLDAYEGISHTRDPEFFKNDKEVA